MYSDKDLDAAVTAGVLTETAATALRSFVASRNQTVPVEEERFRIASGFNDVFVFIACALLLIPIGSLVGAWNGALGYALVAACAWLLAEYFTQVRKMSLPSLGLCVVFIVASSCAWYFASSKGALDQALAGATGAFAAYLHWKRFRVPVGVAAGCCALTVWLAGALGQYDRLFFFAAGIAVFLLAMRWDSCDLNRITYRTDVAFYLHLLAAPLIVHSIIQFLDLGSWQEINIIDGGVVALLFTVLGLVSLAIDRRALMVSALFYVIYVLTALFDKTGFKSSSYLISALTVGAFMLVLAVVWHSARDALLRQLPSPLRNQLPAPRHPQTVVSVTA